MIRKRLNKRFNLKTAKPESEFDRLQELLSRLSEIQRNFEENTPASFMICSQGVADALNDLMNGLGVEDSEVAVDEGLEQTTINLAFTPVKSVERLKLDLTITPTTGVT
jgi:hypothetical protein